VILLPCLSWNLCKGKLSYPIICRAYGGSSARHIVISRTLLKGELMKLFVRLLCACYALFVLLSVEGCGPSKSLSRRNVRENAKTTHSGSKPPAPAKSKEPNDERVDLHKLFGQSPQQTQPQFPWQQLTPQVPASGQAGEMPKEKSEPIKTNNIKTTPQQLLSAVQQIYRRTESLKVDYKSDLLVKLNSKVAQQQNGMSRTIMFKRPNNFVIQGEHLQLIRDGKTV